MPAAYEGTILDEVRQTGRETIYKTIKKSKVRFMAHRL